MESAKIKLVIGAIPRHRRMTTYVMAGDKGITTTLIEFKVGIHESEDLLVLHIPLSEVEIVIEDRKVNEL